MTADLEALAARVRQRAADQAEEALREAVRSLRGGAHALAAIERLVRDETRPIGQTVFEEALRRMGNGYEGCHRRWGCGGRLRYVADRPKRLETLMGPVTIRRAHYHCRSCGQGAVPLDRSLGGEGTSLTPAAKAWMKRRETALYEGRVNAVIRALKALPVRGKDARELVRGGHRLLP